MTISAIIDTNILINHHERLLQEIGYKSFSNDITIRFIVLRPVIRELDQLKSKSNDTAFDARQANHLLNKIVQECPKTPLGYQLNEKVFLEYNYNIFYDKDGNPIKFDYVDDELLEYAKQYQKSKPENQFFFLTDDINLQTIAAHNGFPIKLEEKHFDQEIYFSKYSEKYNFKHSQWGNICTFDISNVHLSGLNIRKIISSIKINNSSEINYLLIDAQNFYYDIKHNLDKFLLFLYKELPKSPFNIDNKSLEKNQIIIFSEQAAIIDNNFQLTFNKISIPTIYRLREIFNISKYFLYDNYGSITLLEILDNDEEKIQKYANEINSKNIIFSISELKDLVRKERDKKRKKKLDIENTKKGNQDNLIMTDNSKEKGGGSVKMIILIAILMSISILISCAWNYSYIILNFV